TGNSGSQQNSRDRKANRAASDMDYRNRFTNAFVYELPLGKSRALASNGMLARVVGGFQISGSMIFSSGRPFTVFASSNNGAIDGTSYADARGPVLYSRTVDCWFYSSSSQLCRSSNPGAPNAFTAPAPGSFGNAGRNALRGPGFSSVDLALQREVEFSERWRL